MLEFQKKKRIRKMLYSPIILILLGIVLFILIKGVWGVYQKNKLSAQNLEREKTELEKLNQRQKNLASSIDYLKTDQGVEDEIRTKFRAIRDGEKVVVIVDNQATVTSETSTTTPEHGLFYKVFHWPQ